MPVTAIVSLIRGARAHLRPLEAAVSILALSLGVFAPVATPVSLGQLKGAKTTIAPEAGLGRAGGQSRARSATRKRARDFGAMACLWGGPRASRMARPAQGPAALQDHGPFPFVHRPQGHAATGPYSWTSPPVTSRLRTASKTSSCGVAWPAGTPRWRPPRVVVGEVLTEDCPKVASPEHEGADRGTPRARPAQSVLRARSPEASGPGP